MTPHDPFALAFNALAHPRRMRLFRLLVDQPEAGRSSSTLATRSGYRRTALAHHLEIMERGGLLRRKRIGNAMTFQLTPGRLVAAMAEVDRLAGQSTRMLQRAS